VYCGAPRVRTLLRRRGDVEEHAAVVGLVLVGHSSDVVRGLAAMIRQAAPNVPVEGAGGLSGGRLGTSGTDVAAAVRRAIRAAGGSGVVVLLDLGSAALSLDLALDELDDEERALVRVTEAPFVEGAVLAAVAAAGGAEVEAVVRAAEGAAVLPKRPRDAG
jgi:PTS hybrid protein